MSSAVTTGGKPWWRACCGVSTADTSRPPPGCCVCLPEQVLANAGTGHFTGVHFLALVSDETTLRARIRHRQGAQSAVDHIHVHVAINDALRTATVPAPHTITRVDTTRRTRGDAIAAAGAWAAEILPTTDRSVGPRPNEPR